MTNDSFAIQRDAARKILTRLQLDAARRLKSKAPFAQVYINYRDLDAFLIETCKDFLLSLTADETSKSVGEAHDDYMTESYHSDSFELFYTDDLRNRVRTWAKIEWPGDKLLQEEHMREFAFDAFVTCHFAIRAALGRLSRAHS